MYLFIVVYEVEMGLISIKRCDDLPLVFSLSHSDIVHSHLGHHLIFFVPHEVLFKSLVVFLLFLLFTFDALAFFFASILNDLNRVKPCFLLSSLASILLFL